MNERVWIAQADTTPVQNPAPLKVVTVVKPGSEQAITIDLGFDQKTKVDLSAVANEKMTMVHVGTKLIVLFDNHSTVTIEPFFDSTGKPLANLDVNLGAGHDVTGDQFASLFPITEDQSVLPAAGGGGSPASGADFHNPTVDPLAIGNPLPLLGPEDLGNFQVNLPLGPQSNFIDTAPGITLTPADVDLNGHNIVDEAGIVAHIGQPGGTSAGNGSAVAHGTFALSDVDGLADIKSLTINGTVIAIADLVTATTATPIVGSNGHGTLVITDYDATTGIGHYTYTLNTSVTESPAQNNGTDTIANGDSFTVVVTDASNLSSNPATILVDIKDDVPSITVSQSVPTLTVDESFLPNGTTPDPGLGHTVDTADFSSAFTVVEGADGGTVSYALTLVSGSSNLIDTATGQAVVLTESGNTISGYVTGHVGNASYLVFTLSVDAASGSATLTQDRAVHELDTNNNNEGISLDSNLVTLTVTATDGDGDVTSKTLDLGSRVTFQDDGPVLVANASTTATVDEDNIHDLLTHGSSPDFFGGTDLLGAAYTTGSLSGLVNFGADGKGSFSFVTGAEQTSALASLNGLGLTSHGDALTFSISNLTGDLIATTGSGFNTRIVLDLHLLSNGNYIVQLFDSVDHDTPPANTADENTTLQEHGQNTQVDSIDFGQIIQATDGDGDHVTLDGAFNVKVIDDVPHVSLSTSPIVYVGIDESAGSQDGANIFGLQLPPNDTTSSSVRNVFATFEATHAGTDLGNDTDIAHAVAGSPAIAYAHGSSPLLTSSITAGADGLSSITYSLQVSTAGVYSGVQTTDGHNIYLYEDAATGLIVGRVGGTDPAHNDANANGTIAFAIAIESDGDIDIAQYLSLKEFNTNSNNETTSLADGAIQAKIVVTDGDGDTASDTTNIGSHILFYDDGPKLAAGAKITAAVDEDGLSWANQDSNPALPGEVTGSDSATATSAVFGNLATLINFGADGEGSFSFKAVNTPQATGLTSDHQAVSIEVVNGTLIGFTGSDPSQNQVFTLTLGTDGSYTFNLLKEIDHPSLDGHTGDNSENSLSIDLSGYITATDGDGDHVDLGAGSFTVSVLDDIPVVSARGAGSVTIPGEDSAWDFQGGNKDLRFFSDTDHGLILTSPSGGTVNTSSHEIWVGSGGDIVNGESLQLAFVTSDGVTHEEQSSATFTVNQQGPAGTYTVHIDATTDAGANPDTPVGLTFKVDGVTYTASGDAANGYTLSGLSDGAVITVEGANGATFDKLVVENPGSDRYDIADIGAHSADKQVLESFTVSEDESAGINTAGDPNPADDHGAPTAGTDAYAVLGDSAIGYAESTESVLVSHNNFAALFSGNAGADQPGSWSFSVTDANGNAFAGVDSGLTTLDHTKILLTTAADGSLVGSANGADVFKVYVDSTGHVWIAQYQAIDNPVAGSDAAAYDDIAKVTADLHIKGTLTDADSDSVSAVSGISLQVQFQDDGPVAVNDTDALGTSQSVTANVITGMGETTPGVDTVGTDGATVTAVTSNNEHGHTATNVNGVLTIIGEYGTLVLHPDGEYTYTRTNGTPVIDNDVFTYTLTDGDGDTASATLTIGISDHGVTVTPPAIGTNADTVYEAGLQSGGSGEGPTQTVATGSIVVNAADGVGSISVANQSVDLDGTHTTIQDGTRGSLDVWWNTTTHTIDYQYTLTQNYLESPAANNGQDTEAKPQFTVIVTDSDGDPGTSNLTINIVDDAPTARDLPSQNVDEGAPSVTGTLNFVQGADGATVTQVNGTNLTFDSTTGWSQIFHTTHGDFQVKADGSYQFTAQANDVYQDNGTAAFTYTVTDGDGDKSTANVAFAVNDTQTPEQVTLSASTVDEGAGANYTFTAILADASHGDTTVTILDGNGASHTITIADGQTTGHVDIASGNGEDVYTDASSLTAHITGVTGGNFEDPGFNSTDVTAKVNDTQTPEQVTLSASTVDEGAGANYTFTAILADASHGDTTVTILDGNGASHTITIADGQTTGHIDIASGNGEDVYTDASSLTAHITGVTGGNFEDPVFNSTDVAATVADTTNTVTATLTAGDAVFGSSGVTVTYTVTLTNADGFPVAPTDNALTFTLASGDTVHLDQGTTSDVVDVFYAYGTFGPTVTNSITGVTGDGEYEKLVTTGSPIVDANTVPTGGGDVSLTLSEAALDTVLDPNDLHAGVVTGTTPSSTGETAQATTGITFTATGENLTLAFDPSAALTVTGLASGYTLSWSLSDSELVGSLIQTAGNVNLGAFVYLALDTTSAAAGISVTPTVTATLVDNLFNAAGTGPVTISGIQVVATDTSGDKVAGSVNLTINDDTPIFGMTDHGIVSDQVNAAILGDLHLNFGADGANATHALSLAGNTAPNDLTLDGTHAILYSVSTDGAALTGYVDNNHNSTFDAGDVTAFTLALNASAGDYTFTLDTPFTEGINIGGSGTGYGSGPDLQNPLTLTVNNVVTQIATVSAFSGHQVSGSTGGWGVDNANFDKNEHMRFDFTNGAVNSPTPVSTFHAAPPEFADFNFSKNGSVTYNVHYVDGSSTGDVTVTENGSLHLGTAGQLISYIDFTAHDGLGKLDLTHIGSVVDVSHDLSFNVTATDGDGDTALGNIGIHLEGSSTLTGTAGVDVFGVGSHSGVQTFSNFSSSDKIDLTGLLDSIYSGAQNQSDINVVVDSSHSSNLKVQVADTSHVFHDVAVLSGYNTAGSDVVNVILNDATHQTHTYTA